MNDSITITLRAYFSRTHIESAALLARKSAAIEARYTQDQAGSMYSEHRTYVIGSVLSAVGCLEAAINEIFADAADGHIQHTKRLSAETILLFARTWKGVFSRRLQYSILDKYECALDLAGCERFDKGAQVFQDVSDLVKLRNALTHYVPESVVAGHGSLDVEDQHDFEKLLSRRFKINPLTGLGNPYYPDKLLGHGCADWATRSTITFVEDFFQRLELSPPFESIKGSLDTR